MLRRVIFLLVYFSVPCIGGPAETTGFNYPQCLVAASNPDRDCWSGIDGSGAYPVPVTLEGWLVGMPPSPLSGVTLQTDHWVELGFGGAIIDGPGPDVYLTEQGKKGEQAMVLLGDGIQAPYPIGVVAAEGTNGPETTEIGIDLAGLTLPFIPTTIRVLSLGLGGDFPGFDMGSVRARVVPSQNPLATCPYPQDGACDVSPHTFLKWRPGSGADRHTVYFGKTLAGVQEGAPPVSQPPQPQEDAQFDPGPLRLGQGYYWRIDESNDSQPGSIRKGDIWQFRVADCGMVDDFESTLFAWEHYEGWSTRVDSFMSQQPYPVYEGCQSMALWFNIYPNDRSGLVRVFSPTQDWMASGAQILELAFYGDQENPSAMRAYLRLSDGLRTHTVTYDGDANALAEPKWHLWKIPLEVFADVDLSRVSSIVLGVVQESDLPVFGKVWFDAMALCLKPCDPAQCRRADLNADCRVDFCDLEQLTDHWQEDGHRRLWVQEPNRPLAWYRFEGNADDSIGSAHGLLIGNATFVEGRIGRALSLSSSGEAGGLIADHMRIPNAGPLFRSMTKGLTFAFWQFGKESSHWIDSLVCSDFEYGKTDPAVHISLGCWELPGHYQWHCGMPWTIDNSLCGSHQDASEWMGRWNHWTFTADLRTGRMEIFLNGSLYAAKQGMPVRLSEILYLDIGHGWYGYYDGWIDDLRIYDYPLCQAETAYLATDGSGLPDRPSSLQADLNGDGRIDWEDFALLALDWLAGPNLD